MNSRKSVGPRMQPWGTPALSGYSCEDFTTPPRTTRRKKELRPDIWPEIPSDLKFVKKTTCETLPEVLDISSATAEVAPHLLKALSILSDTTVRRSAVDWEELKLYWKSQKKATFPPGDP